MRRNALVQSVLLVLIVAIGAVQAETLHLDCSPAKADGYVLQDTLANYGELRVWLMYCSGVLRCR